MIQRRIIAVALAAVASPAMAADPTPICTDRPTKANAVCTVPKGKFQLESSLANWSLTKAQGTRTTVLSIGSTALKYGIDDSSDLQVIVTPWVRARTSATGSHDTLSSFGDVLVRYKRRLTPSDAPVQAAIIPFVKVPTARRGIGNRKVEGGVAVPVSMALGKATLTLGPEVDALADGDGRGRHFALVNLGNVAVPVSGRVSLIGELWSNFNFDPAGTIKQASADAAIAYAVSAAVQVDAGVNLGLTRDTPDAEVYAGLSLRY